MQAGIARGTDRAVDAVAVLDGVLVGQDGGVVAGAVAGLVDAFAGYAGVADASAGSQSKSVDARCGLRAVAVLDASGLDGGGTEHEGVLAGMDRVIDAGAGS